MPLTLAASNHLIPLDWRRNTLPAVDLSIAGFSFGGIANLLYRSRRSSLRSPALRGGAANRGAALLRLHIGAVRSLRLGAARFYLRCSQRLLRILLECSFLRV